VGGRCLGDNASSQGECCDILSVLGEGCQHVVQVHGDLILVKDGPTVVAAQDFHSEEEWLFA